MSFPTDGGDWPPKPKDDQHLMRTAFRRDVQNWTWGLFVTSTISFVLFVVLVVNLFTGGALLWPFVRWAVMWVVTLRVSIEFRSVFKKALAEEG